MRAILTPLRLVSLCLAALAPSLAGAQTALTIPGQNGLISFTSDAFGNPQITATTEFDAARAQGYLHARDRFFQMDFNRRAASGRVAELVGPNGLASDVQLRTLGISRAAWATWVALDNDTRGWLKAYADGVNAFLAGNPLPPEYSALELTGVPQWSPLDSLVIGKVLALQLSFDLSDIDFTINATAYQVAGQIGGFNGAALFAEDTHRAQPPDDRISMPGFLTSIGGVGAAAGGAPPVAGKGVTEVALEVPLGEIDPALAAQAANYRQKIAGIPFFDRALDPAKQGAGSNSWAVSGSKTASGVPLIANDPHLSLGTPSIFVEESLTVTGAGGFTISGVAFAGIPGIVQGCTANFCWGSTVNPMDVTDVYQEQFQANNLGLPVATIFQGQAEPLQIIFQSFFVNTPGDGSADNLTRAEVPLDAGGVTFVVPRRNNGPIVDVDSANGTALSVQYAGWGPTFELVSFRLINKATTLAEFEDALQWFDIGSQNFIYADNAGNIAHFTSGEMPLRADLQNQMTADGGRPPWLIRDGTGTLNHEWLPVQNPQPQQAVPFEILPWGEMPKLINPARGYVVTANNDPIGTSLDNNPLNQVRPGGGLYYLNFSYVSYRMGRIDRGLEQLTAAGNVTLDDMIVLQANNQLRDAEILSPLIVQAFNNAATPGAWPGLAQFAADPRLQQAVARLATWDAGTPTGIQQGYDPGDNPAALPAPSAAEIAASINATIFSVWRGQMIKNTLDGTLTAIGLGDFLPDERAVYHALTYQLRNFAQTRGAGASGIPFFNVPGAPAPEDARDVIILKSLQDALALLASDEFAPAFANSTNQDDYRWGRLHRIVFDHPLGVDPFNIPNGGGFTDLAPGLPGIPRAGGYEAVDASRHSSRADGPNEFMFGAGPARRFVAEMRPGGERLEVIPGGRSGIFFSPMFSNQLPLWLTNDFHDMP